MSGRRRTGRENSGRRRGPGINARYCFVLVLAALVLAGLYYLELGPARLIQLGGFSDSGEDASSNSQKEGDMRKENKKKKKEDEEEAKKAKADKGKPKPWDPTEWKRKWDPAKWELNMTKVPTNNQQFVKDLPFREGHKAYVTGGTFYQVEGCPYALTERQAEQAERNKKLKTNSIELARFSGGRSGNHYMMVSGYLSMAYCCRSRVLTLPAKDSTLPGEDGNFYAHHRYFGFSNVTLPWVEYQKIGDDPKICRPTVKEGGNMAFGYEATHQTLLDCMNRVYMRGCERAYLGSLTDTEAFCPKRNPKKKKGDGALVLHVRSGDIFNPKGQGRKRPWFGQPPLQYFLHVIAAKKWDSITILTSFTKIEFVNPTYSVLETLAQTGVLGENAHSFRNRRLLDDVREMLCADALAVTKSSLSFLTLVHTRANTVYLPETCGTGTFKRMKRAPVKATYQNTTQLILEKPGMEVHGVKFGGHKEGADYSVYKAWHDTPEQLLEMTMYSGISMLERCAAT